MTFQLLMPGDLFNPFNSCEQLTNETAPLVMVSNVAITASFSTGLIEQVEYTSLPLRDNNSRPFVRILN